MCVGRRCADRRRQSCRRRTVLGIGLPRGIGVRVDVQSLLAAGGRLRDGLKFGGFEGDALCEPGADVCLVPSLERRRTRVKGKGIRVGLDPTLRVYTVEGDLETLENGRREGRVERWIANNIQYGQEKR